MSGKIVLKGSTEKVLLKIQKRASAEGDDRFFRIIPFGGRWFVESIEWQTDKSIVPPLRFSATLVQVHKMRKSK